jgi:hypothetical protein
LQLLSASTSPECGSTSASVKQEAFVPFSISVFHSTCFSLCVPLFGIRPTL